MTNQNTEELTVDVEKKDNCLVEYSVKTPPNLVKEAKQKALKSIAKEVTLPGFRKGKAPAHLIETKYKDHLDERWQKAIADLAFVKANEIAKVPVLNGNTRISFNMEKYSVEDGAELKFSFETEPAIPEIHIDELKIEDVPLKKVDDETLQIAIDDMREYFGTWTDVTDRGVQEDDYITIDVDIIDKDPPESALSNTRFKVNKERMAKWMQETVLGMKVGESKEAMSEPDEDAPEDVKKETPAKKVKVTVRNIQVMELPEVNDELAKKVGAKDVEDMKAKIKSTREMQAQHERTNALRDQICEKLVDTYPFELPLSLINQEIEYRMRQLATDKSFQERFKTMSELERKEEIKKLETYGKRAISLFYLCRKIIDSNDIEISPEDIDREIHSPIEAAMSKHEDDYNAKNRSQEQQSIALSRAMLKKAQDFIIEKCLIPKEST